VSKNVGLRVASEGASNAGSMSKALAEDVRSMRGGYSAHSTHTCLRANPQKTCTCAELARTMYIYTHSVYTVILAGLLSDIWSYTAFIYGSGQPCDMCLVLCRDGQNPEPYTYTVDDHILRDFPT